MQPESLTDYLNRKKPKPAPRKPVWLRRMEEKGLPAKDYTRLTPERPDAA